MQVGFDVRYRVVYRSDSRGSAGRSAVELSTSPENAGYALRRTRRHCGGMCENCDIEPARELIQGLLMEAGRLMEDDNLFDFDGTRSIGVTTESQPKRPAAAPALGAIGALSGGSSEVLLRLEGAHHDQTQRPPTDPARARRADKELKLLLRRGLVAETETSNPPAAVTFDPTTKRIVPVNGMER